jgi:octaprenyl-diphosphate synthase
VARLASFGRNLGIAFQIADDLLDLEGNELATGKSLGTDLAKRKMTLPLIHARDTLDPSERQSFLAALASGPAAARQSLLNYLNLQGSFDYTREQAQLYADRAQADLTFLPETAAKDALAALAEFAIARRG